MVTESVIMAQGCNPRTQEGEAGEFSQVLGQPKIYSEFKTTLEYTVRFCLIKKKNWYKAAQTICPPKVKSELASQYSSVPC